VTTLRAQLVANAHAEKRQAWSDYVSIVKRADAAEDGDAARIVEICDLLNIPLDDVDADAKAYRHLPSVIDRAKLVGPLGDEIDKLNKKLGKLKDALAEHDKKKKAEIRGLSHDAEQLVYQFGVAAEAKKQIERMHLRHWRIFNRPSPMPPSMGVGKAAGKIHPEALKQLLATEPSHLTYGHTGDGAVIAALEVDYRRVKGTQNEWVRTDLNGEKK